MHTLETETGCAVVLTRAELAALVGFASRDLGRPHVSSVLFDPARGVACATDGHRLLRASFGARPGAERFLAGIRRLEWLVKHAWSNAIEENDEGVHVAKKDDLWIILDASTGRLVDVRWDYSRYVWQPVFTEVARVQLEPVADDVAFPPFEAVIPRYDRNLAGVSQTLSGKFVAESATLLAAAADNIEDGLRFFPPTTGEDPFVIEAQGRGVRDHGPLPTKWTAVIMPKRDGEAVKLTSCANWPLRVAEAGAATVAP